MTVFAGMLVGVVQNVQKGLVEHPTVHIEKHNLIRHFYMQTAGFHQVGNPLNDLTYKIVHGLVFLMNHQLAAGDPGHIQDILNRHDEPCGIVVDVLRQAENVGVREMVIVV